MQPRNHNLVLKEGFIPQEGFTPPYMVSPGSRQPSSRRQLQRCMLYYRAGVYGHGRRGSFLLHRPVVLFVRSRFIICSSNRFSAFGAPVVRDYIVYCCVQSWLPFCRQQQYIRSSLWLLVLIMMHASSILVSTEFSVF